MLALLQRVKQAKVTVAGTLVGEIGPGLLVFVGIEKADTEAHAERLLKRLLAYRVFSDGEGRMNRSLTEVQGGLLLVPQFTLCADTGKGNRPNFSPAATPADGQRLFGHLLACARAALGPVPSGRFGAYMEVSLQNDGPVTFLLRTGA